MEKNLGFNGFHLTIVPGPHGLTATDLLDAFTEHCQPT